MVLAAIDIGSNAARLLVSETSVYTDGTVDFTKLCLLRIPLRLGFDVFDKGYVTDEKKKKLIEGNWWHDYYWGVCSGRGKNKLGEILMRVREELRG